MTAVTALDATLPVEYFFTHTGGGAGGSSSTAWQASPVFTDTGLAPSTLYSYTVRTRDADGNETAESAAISVTTPP